MQTQSIISLARLTFNAILLSALLLLTSQPSFAGQSAAIANKTKNILFVISSDKHGYWLPEVVEPYQILSEAGFHIDIASPQGGTGVQRGANRLTKKYKTWYKTSKLKQQLASTLPLANIKSKLYGAIYFAGGAGPMFDLINNLIAQEVTRDIFETGGLVAADCHGPAALVNVKLSNGEFLVKGRQITAKANSEEGRWARANYPYLLENKFKELGGIYSSAENGKPHVVVDDNLITGQNPASAILVAEKMLQFLNQP